MKKRHLFGFFILLSLLVSCHDDCETTNDSNLKGTWNLVNVTGEINSENFPSGQITWKFNTGAHTVKILNNSMSLSSGFPTGDYGFNLTDNIQTGEEMISVNASNLGILSFSGNVMYMDLSSVDGLKYKFAR